MPDWVVPLAALLGIIVGALLQGAVNLWLDERRESKRERAALRLLGQDLLRAESMIRTAVHRQEWWPATWTVASSAWETQRELLAARSGSRDWGAIAWAFFNLYDLEAHVEVLRADAAAAGRTVPLFNRLPDTADLEAALANTDRARAVVERLLDGPIVDLD